MCRKLLRGHYENFLVASPFLPRRLRAHFARLYAYCRTTDDLGDEGAGDAEMRLRAWSEDLERCFEGDPPRHPVLLALGASVRELGLAREPFFDLVAANLQDQRVSGYETWAELRAYCMLSAAPVGRVVLELFEVRDEPSRDLSDDVCIGLQLANFAQDVRSDWERRGRTYLIQQDLRDHGTSGAVRAMCARANLLLRSGFELEARLPRRARAQVALYRLGGEAILAAIRGAGYSTAERRPALSLRSKIGLYPIAAARMVTT